MPVRALLTNSPAAYSVARGDAQRKAGAVSTATADGRGLELAPVGERKNKTH